MGGMMTGSPVGRGCTHGISVHGLALPARWGHEESGTVVSSTSNPWGCVGPQGSVGPAVERVILQTLPFIHTAGFHSHPHRFTPSTLAHL